MEIELNEDKYYMWCSRRNPFDDDYVTVIYKVININKSKVLYNQYLLKELVRIPEKDFNVIMNYKTIKVSTAGEHKWLLQKGTLIELSDEDGNQIEELCDNLCKANNECKNISLSIRNKYYQ